MTRLLAAPAVLLLALAVTWAAGGQSVQAGPVPLLVVCAAAAVAVQWLAWVPSALAKTERYYDLVGSLTYLGVTALALGGAASADALDPRKQLLAALVFVWALRLGSFLFQRIRKAGQDRRFDELRQSPSRFLVAWSLQGLWVCVTALAAWIAITEARPGPALGISDGAGVAVWILGFGLEVVADTQKSAFKADPANRGRFISTGLWAWSRHPNYLGEILLWCGVLLVAARTLQGAQWLALISPAFVTLLLTRISGIPSLEAHAEERWGDDEEYRIYKARTPLLIPRPPRG